MPLTQHAVKGNPRFILDVIGGQYRIATHSLPELLLDARRTHNKAILPLVEISNDVIKIGRQPLMRWFATKMGVEAKIVMPEHCELNVRMFTGELSLSGSFRSIDVRLRTGNVTLEGPYFELAHSGVIRIANGNLRCHKLTEAGFELPLSEGKIKHIGHSNGVQLRVELGLGELDFS